MRPTLIFVFCLTACGNNLTGGNPPADLSPPITEQVEVSHETMTIIGFGFGTGGNIIIWDSFEFGNDGASIMGEHSEIGPSEWTNDNYANPYGITNTYESENPYAGGLFYRQHIFADSMGFEDGEREWKQPIVMNFGDTLPATRVYLSYFHRYRRSGDKARQVKMPRLSKFETYNEPGEIGLTHQDAAGAGIFYGNYGEVAQAWVGHADVVDEWHRFEYSGDVGSGYARYDWDMILQAEVFPPPLDSTPIGRLAMTNVLQMNADTQGTFDYDFDNLYLSDTLARVEIGNKSTWSDCTERMVLPFTSWSETQITANLDATVVGFDEPYYIYVVNEDGTPGVGYLLP